MLHGDIDLEGTVHAARLPLYGLRDWHGPRYLVALERCHEHGLTAAGLGHGDPPLLPSGLPRQRAHWLEVHTTDLGDPCLGWDEASLWQGLAEQLLRQFYAWPRSWIARRSWRSPRRSGAASPTQPARNGSR
jgi:hypothetical protein